MAAAYSNGVSGSPSALLNAIAAFLVAQGWTQDSLINEGTGRRGHLHKNGLYFNARAAVNENGLLPNSSSGLYNDQAGYGLLANLGSGYNGGLDWHEQPGRPVANGTSVGVAVGMRLPVGNVVGYHLFDDGNDNVDVVVEITPGKYQYMGFGPSMVKRGYTWDSPYIHASLPGFYALNNPNTSPWGFVPGANPIWPMGQWNEQSSPPGASVFTMATGYIRVDSSVFSGLWVACMSDDTASGVGSATRNGFTGRYAMAGVHGLGNQLGVPGYFMGGQIETTQRGTGKLLNATAFQRTLLLPLHQYYKDSAGSGRFIPLGYLPTSFRFAGLDPGATGFAEKQILPIGAKNYMLFPRFAVLKAA